MPELPVLMTFLAAIVVICVVPGPDQLYIVANGLRHGPRGGLAAAAGMAVGMLVHTTAAVVGLSALVRSSATAFELVRVGGGLYLLWLAVEVLGADDSAHSVASGCDRDAVVSSLAITRQAVVTNLLNPKIIVFYLAFLPQFVDSGRGPVAPQMLFLGLLFASVGFMIDAAVGVFAGRLGRRLSQSDRVRSSLSRVAAVVYVGLAGRLLLERS